MKTHALSLLIMMSAAILGGCAASRQAPTNGSASLSSSSSSIPLLGGDRDAHGCIPSAGYQWCEAKKKCLRVWEEPCTSNASSIDISSWKTYRNDSMGFTLRYPPSWEGFKATEGSYPTYKYVGFSFYGPRQPFQIFKVVQYSKEEWKTVGKNLQFTILSQSDDPPFVCDGCCEEGGDTTGGGQFDEFQQKKCAEVPSLLRTFQRLNQK